MTSTTCPRCAGSMQGAAPAISRADNSTRVCSLCGNHEALQWRTTGTCTATTDWPVQLDELPDWRAFRRALENGGAR